MPARRVALLGGRAIARSNADGDEPVSRKLSLLNSSARLRRSLPMKSCCAYPAWVIFRNRTAYRVHREVETGTNVCNFV